MPVSILVVRSKWLCGAVGFCGLFAWSGCDDCVNLCVFACRSTWCCFCLNWLDLEGVSGMCSGVNLARQLGRVVKAVD